MGESGGTTQTDGFTLRSIANAADLFEVWFEHSLDALCIVDLDGVIRQWNQSAKALFGWSADEVLGSQLPFVPEDLRIKIVCDLRSIVCSEQPTVRKSVARRRDGSTFRMELRVCPLRDEDGHVCGAMFSCGADPVLAATGGSEDAFTSIITQELRSPLTAILGYSQLLARPEILDDPVRRSRTLRALQERGDGMARIIDDLIFAAAIDREGLEVEVETVDVISLVTDVVGRHEVEKGPHRYILEMDPGLPHIHVDPALVSDALGRLLRNAAMYAPGGGDIIVSVRSAGDGVDIVVSDSGIGLTSTELARVFDRFYQADVSTDRRFEGMGLGLYIVSAIARAHGGVAVARAREAGGSSFTLHLPASGSAALGG